MPLNVHIKSRQSNTVNAHVEIYGKTFERGEIIIGNIGLYFKVEFIENMAEIEDGMFYLFVLLENLAKGAKGKKDKIIYSCNLSSEGLEMVNQRFICDDSQWRILYKFPTLFKKPLCGDEFDISVKLDTIEIKNPLAAMYNDIELVDFEICSASGSVAFHSVSLAAASPVLRQMLTGKWKETESRKLKLQDTTLQTLQHLKEYLYLNILPNNNSDIENLLRLASYYLMTELENMCKEKLISLGHCQGDVILLDEIENDRARISTVDMIEEA